MKPEENARLAAEKREEAEGRPKKPYGKTKLTGFGGVERLTGIPRFS